MPPQADHFYYLLPLRTLIQLVSTSLVFVHAEVAVIHITTTSAGNVTLSSSADVTKRLTSSQTVSYHSTTTARSANETIHLDSLSWLPFGDQSKLFLALISLAILVALICIFGMAVYFWRKKLPEQSYNLADAKLATRKQSKEVYV